MSEVRKPFWVKCQPCGHVWTAAYYPMEATTFARVTLAARCPMCGSKKVQIAKQNDGELQEAATA